MKIYKYSRSQVKLLFVNCVLRRVKHDYKHKPQILSLEIGFSKKNSHKMWRRSASFVLDKHQNNKPISLNPSIDSPPPPSASMADENPNPISAYYQTRAAHHGVVTSDWLEQAQAAVRRYPDHDYSTSPVAGRPFSVIEEFNSWRQQPDLAEAVAAIRALAAVIRASEATTMMELEIELKKASDTLKVSIL